MQACRELAALPTANGSRQRPQAAAAAAPPLVLPATLQWVRECSFCRQRRVCSAIMVLRCMAAWLLSRSHASASCCRPGNAIGCPPACLQEDFMNNCAVRTVLSAVLGSGMGVMFGIFMGTMDTVGAVGLKSLKCMCVARCVSHSEGQHDL